MLDKDDRRLDIKASEYPDAVDEVLTRRCSSWPPRAVAQGAAGTGRCVGDRQTTSCFNIPAIQPAMPGIAMSVAKPSSGILVATRSSWK
mmetsp:Transcript_77228/g.136281  ORF Transcript_77228/g.136281 Transcript_77228/m.136281 type:complete len:89 (+) Transcript_77228:796-1062(+)